ncbi:hypothetical protein [Halanaeroarchaeum sulfurireducens]|uniref:DUF7964 domain-containing protein n=1 Tax=Halanaeroarchaeum sulfurireducens TaxID=1604004 RepID=A0A0F7PCD3_9EURY|nr:hypothetical protein [Halanaeroarchaeum sulfurireducens]AKH97284.1 hypothetical protein HLASF_0789 [Halanaeroarchaeum sulfurireducens]ALG81686.1 hypothetical protein HLASA_0786 [Halanaeroarchaeum sulfurireducens]
MRLSSLPDRPVTQAEVAALNESDRLAMAVPVAQEDATRADDGRPVTITDQLILATDAWVVGLVYGAEWQTVERVEIDDPKTERFEALQTCEGAIEGHVDQS